MNFNQLRKILHCFELSPLEKLLIYELFETESISISNKGLSVKFSTSERTAKRTINSLLSQKVASRERQRSPLFLNPVELWECKKRDEQIEYYRTVVNFNAEHKMGKEYPNPSECAISGTLSVPSVAHSPCNTANAEASQDINDFSHFQNECAIRADSQLEGLEKNNKRKDLAAFSSPLVASPSGQKNSESNINCPELSEAQIEKKYIFQFKEDQKNSKRPKRYVESEGNEYLKSVCYSTAFYGTRELGPKISLINSMKNHLDSEFVSGKQERFKFSLFQLIDEGFKRGKELYHSGTKLYTINSEANSDNDLCRWFPSDYFENKQFWCELNVDEVSVLCKHIQSIAKCGPLSFEDMRFCGEHYIKFMMSDQMPEDFSTAFLDDFPSQPELRNESIFIEICYIVKNYFQRSV